MVFPLSANRAASVGALEAARSAISSRAVRRGGGRSPMLRNSNPRMYAQTYAFKSLFNA